MNDFTRRSTDKFVVNSVTVETVNPPPKTEADLLNELREAETPDEVTQALNELDKLNEER